MTGLTPPSDQPPSTNRGVVRPNDDRLCGGVDYLKLTVWASPESVMEVLSGGVLDRYGWSVDPLDPQEEWTEEAGRGRTERIFNAGSLEVLEFTDEVLNGDVFCSVEVKGRGCAHFGNVGIRLILDDLDAMYRIRASRVDLMAHTEMFTPRVVRDTVNAGDFCSRTVSTDKMVWVESVEGDTCYLGMVSKPRGGMKRAGDRILRVYDRRGPTRIELDLRGDYAHGAGYKLCELPVEQWPILTRGCMRHYCDFVDRTADPRPTRCPPLPWWRAFIEDIEKISVRVTEDPLYGTPIGKLDGIFQRYCRRLYAGLVAYGPEWVIRRVEWHGKRSTADDHQQLVAELSRYKGTGLAGVPDDDEEVPF